LPYGKSEVQSLIEATGANLVILDSLRRLAPGMREDKSDDTAPVLAALAEVAQDSNTAIVVIHHRSTKREAAEVRGSSAFEDQADLVWVLEKIGGDPERGSRRRLRCIKARDDEEPGAVWVSFKPVDGVMTLGAAESYDGSAAVAAASASSEEAMAERMRALAEQVATDGGWPPSRLAAAVGTNQNSGTFKRALGHVLAGGSGATGYGKSRRVHPHESGQSGISLGDSPIGLIEDDRNGQPDDDLFDAIGPARKWMAEQDATPLREPTCRVPEHSRERDWRMPNATSWVCGHCIAPFDDGVVFRNGARP
jgi:AAA domain